MVQLTWTAFPRSDLVFEREGCYRQQFGGAVAQAKLTRDQGGDCEAVQQAANRALEPVELTAAQAIKLAEVAYRDMGETRRGRNLQI
jgi:hypothetical protein